MSVFSEYCRSLGLLTTINFVLTYIKLLVGFHKSETKTYYIDAIGVFSGSKIPHRITIKNTEIAA